MKKQTFNMETLKRSDINLSDYNPRKWSEEAKKKMKKVLKKHGLVSPLIVNKGTGNTLVSGHLRLTVLDEINKSDDYELDVAVIDVPEAQEVELNIIMNNPSIMGEWDTDLLQEIHDTFPELDFIKDMGFEKIDIDFMDIKLDIEEISNITKAPVEMDNAKANKIKNESRNQYKETINNNAGIAAEPFRNDYILTVVFPSNNEKWSFMRGINMDEKQKFLKYDEIIEFIRDDYRLPVETIDE